MGGRTIWPMVDWVRDDGLLLVDTPSEFPSFARGTTTWIRVSLSRQTLVAYEGERPVYATLVSTGKDGAGDPKTTLSTVQGQFRIHAKHVTARMDNDEPDDEYDHRDVPWVAYFSEGYALHAAYWHVAFGAPRSHGCVNLSPADARFLFHWTEPAVPQLWHGALGAGTRVVIVE
jgi:lipoprotein-anchoring transpeptidase ErfK/SrfK